MNAEQIRKALGKDYLERDSKTFVYQRKTGRVDWEKVPSGGAYSKELLGIDLSGLPTKDVLIKAYGIVCRFLDTMDLPERVRLKFNNDSDDSYTDSKTITVSTKVFDDPTLSLEHKMDILFGTAEHEGLHCEFTDFGVREPNSIIRDLHNIVEDEMIEHKAGDKYPGLVVFLRLFKYYYFEQYRKQNRAAFDSQDNACRLINSIIALVRYPSALTDKELEDFGKYLLQVKDVLKRFPKNTGESHERAVEIYEIIKDALKDMKKNGGKPGDKGDSKKGESGKDDKKGSGKSKGSEKSEDKDGSGEGSGKSDDKDDSKGRSEKKGSGKSKGSEKSEDEDDSEDGSDKKGSDKKSDKESRGEEGDEEGEEGGSKEGDSDETGEDGGEESSSKGENEGEDGDEGESRDDDGEESSSRPGGSKDGKDRKRSDKTEKDEGEEEGEWTPSDEESMSVPELTGSVDDALKKIGQILERYIRDTSSTDQISRSARGEEFEKVCEGKAEYGDDYSDRACSSAVIIRTDDREHCDEPGYTRCLNEVRKYVPAMRNILVSQATKLSYQLKGMHSGRLDGSKLSQAYIGSRSVYCQQKEIKANKVAVCVLIDESGSMCCGSKIQAARNTAVLLNEALGNLPNVDLFIYGHTANASGYDADLQLRVYRDHGSRNKFSLGRVAARCNNLDGYAILETARQVRRQTNEKVLFFVISDGQPAAEYYSGYSAVRHTKQCVEEVTKMGFCPVQIAIDSCFEPSSMFRHFVKLTDMATLPKELGAIIQKAVLDNTKRQ